MLSPESESQLPSQRSWIRSLWILAFAVAVGVAGFSAYQRAFSTFAEYDDEGYVMLSLSQHRQGGVLYDEVFSQYGPAWYTCQRVVHSVGELPVTHDVTRMKTIVIWILAALLTALAVVRVSGCRFTAFAAFALAFLHLDRLTLEPGHPQELCLLAVAGVLLLSTFEWCTCKRGLVLLSVVVGTAVMTKLNVGLLLVASITLALALTTANDRLRRVASFATTLLIVFGVAVVTRSTVGEERGLRLPTLVGFSMLSVAGFAYWSDSLRKCRLQTQLLFQAGWVTVAVGFVVLVLQQGTSFGALLDGLVLQHLGFADRFYMAAPVFGFAGPLAMFACVAAMMTVRGRHKNIVVRYVRLCFLALVAGVMLKHFFDLRHPVQHGLDDRAHAGLIVSFVGPFAWLVLVRNSGQQWSNGQWFGRIMLACVGGLQPLIAYPTPGTQMAVGSLPLLMIVLICVRDFVTDAESAAVPTGFGKNLRIALVACPGVLLCISAWHANAYMQRMEPLNLAGAERLSLPPRQVQELQSLVSAIHENGNTFVSLHNGYNSLYLWADMEPPTGLNATFWPWMLSDAQQQRVVEALESQPRVCCVEKVVPGRIEEPSTPLGDFLTDGFATQATIGIWRVMSNSR